MARQSAMSQPKPDRMAAARAAKARKREEREQETIGRSSVDPTDLHIDDIEGLSASRRQAVASARKQTRAARNIEREPLRQPMRAENGRIIVRGRDGEMLTRKRTNTGDKFAIDKEDIPEGYTYQWIAESVLGNSDKEMISTVGFHENGWRPVPASRHPGQFMPVGYSGPIRRDGQVLVERPKELTDEARQEEIGAARNLIRTQNEQFQPRLPQARAGQRGTQLQASRTYEPMPVDIDRPSYEVASPPP